MTDPAPARLVVLVSGSGSNLQALLDATADPAYGARVVAVGADRDAIAGLDRAAAAGVPTFVDSVKAYPTRDDWDAALTAHVAEHKPDLVISAGFLKLVGARFLAAFGDRTSTPTTRCCRRSRASTAPATPSPTASRSPGRPCSSSTPASTPARSSPRSACPCSTTTRRRR